MLLTSLCLILAGGLPARAQDKQNQSPFTLPDDSSFKGTSGQPHINSSPRSVFRLPDEKNTEIQQKSPFSLPETPEPSPTIIEPVPIESANPEDLFREATAAAKQGHFEEAEKMYTQLLEIDPANVKAMNNLGLVLKKIGRKEDALQAYQYAIETDESYPLTYKNVGILLEEMNDSKGAIEAYRAYIRVAPEAQDAAAVIKRLKWLTQ